MMIQIWMSFLFVVLFIRAERTLVLVDDVKESETLYGEFLKELKVQGHELSVHKSTDANVLFVRFGDYQYQNVIVLAPTTNKLGSISWSDMHEFVANGGNVMLSSSKKLSKTQRQFATECGVQYDMKGKVVMDHFNHVKDPMNVHHTAIYADSYSAPSTVIGTVLESKKHKVEFEGIGQISQPNNILNFAVLHPANTAYSGAPAKPVTDVKGTTGDSIALVSAVQARNNARMVFSGSLELFTDEKWKNPDLSNRRLVTELCKWVFQKSGVLRVSNISHSRHDGSHPERMLKSINRPDQPISLYPEAEITRDTMVYRIKDNLTYALTIHEYRDGEWHPFKADDLQLEFVMLDPYVRKTMVHDDKGRFSVTFESPDTYGIFQFRIMYRRLGYSTIHETTQVSLRPFKHDEYERFIPSAYPYYASAISMMAGIFVLSALFLYAEP